MDGFWHKGDKVPEGIWVLAVGSRVALLGVDKVWELGGIAAQGGPVQCCHCKNGTPSAHMLGCRDGCTE